MSRFNPGDVVSGKYRIVRLIGDGGMGVVYEARHEVLGSGVALKFLHADLAKRPGLTQRFLQEARVSATIQSAHVTHVTDVDMAQDGSPYLVMELLSGQSLQGMLDHQGRLSLEQTIDFSLQILAGLEAAHALGVVHRDMKPDNVFVTPTGGGPLLKLIDFGIAKLRASSEYTKGLTRAGVVMGTPEYMAPEQLVSAHTTDHRADIYSLGVMMFEMLAGCRPADGDDAEVIIAAVEGGRVRHLKELMPELPDGLVALIERAMLPDREQRFESASAMRLAVAPFAGHLSHAGRLAATAEPLAPLTTPMSSVMLSLPQSSAPPPRASSAPPPGVPRTLPPDGPPLSVSQLGAARTSLSEAPPVMSPQPPATAMGGPGLPYASSHLPMPLPVPHQPSRKGRSGILVSLVLLAVLVGGGAVGYAAYRAADDRRVVVPPLPDAAVAAPTGTLKVEPLNPDVKPEPPRPGVTSTPIGGSKPPLGAKPPTGTTPPDTGVSNPGQVVVGSGGSSSTIQFPFPIPSSIQIPTALPSGIQFPPGIAFPPGFPGVPQQPPATSPTPTTPPATTPPATTPAPTAPPVTTDKPKRPVPSTKP